MTLVFTRTIATQGLFTKKFLICLELRPVNIGLCSFLTQSKTQFESCMTTPNKKNSVKLTSLQVGATNSLPPFQFWQRKRYFYSIIKQQTTLQLQEARCTKIYLDLPAQQSVRAISSSAILASGSAIHDVSQRQSIGETELESADKALAVQQTATDLGLQPGLDNAINSLTDTNASTSLLCPDFPTIRAAEQTILKLHEITGLPWWATITLTALTLRLVFLMPLSVYALRSAEKLSRLQPEIEEISKRLKQEVSMAMYEFKWDETKAKDEYIKNMKRLMRDLYIRNNCLPMKSTASFWLQCPLWVSVSYSLRNMTSRAVNPEFGHHEECTSLTYEGTLWFSDLTLTDSTWILPALMGFVTLFNIEMTHLKIGEDTKYRRRLTVFLRCFALVCVPICSTVPSVMVFYWVNSGFLAAVQNILYDYTPFRRLVGLGPSPTESTSPVKALTSRAKQKYFKG